MIRLNRTKGKHGSRVSRGEGKYVSKGRKKWLHNLTMKHNKRRERLQPKPVTESDVVFLINRAMKEYGLTRNEAEKRIRGES